MAAHTASSQLLAYSIEHAVREVLPSERMSESIAEQAGLLHSSWQAFPPVLH